MSLEKLIQLCKKQDRKAQEQLYRLYSAKLFGLCLKYSGGYAEAQDNLQDGFLTIFAKISQYNDSGSFEGWMKRIIINTALQKHRKQKVYGLTNEELLKDENIEVEAEEDISLDFLLSCVQELPERYRQVFNLYVLDGYSHREISKMLQISEGTSKSNLARARLALKDRIENQQEDLNSAHSL
ncbi:MAG: sigma-70 family RNA polymerase sigma factor [Bacteroidota bacterium]|uniref:RNA polymerase ECF-type sigma factor n=1 Tax=Christiangramia flava JLT2011 TaxID=1229726 RepID=A0A1L7I366_9FLAO|nr:sigma-70 family RNA polymerase sigma factor [Christiangramia flava]APU68049.1 RNA polymerase ECF-type sigma factor [Christiangramia flava JLT2011]MAM17740.1 sigma-70 family RNA polymerase sigma factor [Christiangramia sp.]MEE2772754.1 sigma-70 family RNA polymerase sigma factor [Bacteroidota bacterium]OSS40551.1 RNA polymerase ECF-type sigma factor [Christiangramia flava JLT2011]